MKYWIKLLKYSWIKFAPDKMTETFLIQSKSTGISHDVWISN